MATFDAQARKQFPSYRPQPQPQPSTAAWCLSCGALVASSDVLCVCETRATDDADDDARIATARQPGSIARLTDDERDALDTLRHAYRHVERVANAEADGCSISTADEDALGVLDECLSAVEEHRAARIDWM